MNIDRLATKPLHFRGVVGVGTVSDGSPHPPDPLA